MAATYRQIVTDIRARIESGELAPGAAVPSTRRLVADYGVAMATATKALTALRQAGLVRPVPGVGTVVADVGRSPEPIATPARRGGQRPPRPATPAGRDEVVHAAIALADADGLTGVSMRRVATELGIATMSVYRHVASRDELVTLMLDTAIGERPLPDPPPAGWRARCEAAARAMWGFCQRHPWAAQALSMTRPQSIPNGMDYSEWLLAAFDGYELELDTRFQLGLSVLMYTRGLAVNIEPEVRAREDTGLTDEEWMLQQKPSMLAIADQRRFPQLSVAMHDEVDADLDSMFEFGLARLLDGIDSFLAAHGRPTAARR
ncbi:TetR/AcrR family transcriptional regulator C-terminal domain-containing protein [Actinocatenispora comari]|uniref:GntR family transcriptional regulator n=1 Tax=Actinocatenispora comari TaxID=2807577 RepID=A0A8J4A9V7_9ACTN|nr:TetR/AcrR family transcriptional regulator C-terminal domain-containing protein [Actinocatenispora comari]GIL25232.1 GntR family transcriptional regulator [Actinocatenispora comari]